MEKIDKLLTIEQASKQLHISPRTLNNARNVQELGVVIAHTGEVRGLLDMVTSTEKNTFTHTGRSQGIVRYGIYRKKHIHSHR